ncbi:hypothetical protein VKT23_010866 [Stygiomarasmius scandens]|uniref:Uncharacterized protein n=1 Tax=Marasmiellus scandens TaxID=2682957 RepID=A0ABR1JAG4_9AGAR
MQHSTAVVIALDSRQCNITMLFTPIIACSRPHRLPTRLCPFSSPVISVPTLTLPLPSNFNFAKLSTQPWHQTFAECSSYDRAID